MNPTFCPFPFLGLLDRKKAKSAQRNKVMDSSQSFSSPKA